MIRINSINPIVFLLLDLVKQLSNSIAIKILIEIIQAINKQANMALAQ
jgi:hypothetical protein